MDSYPDRKGGTSCWVGLVMCSVRRQLRVGYWKAFDFSAPGVPTYSNDALTPADDKVHSEFDPIYDCFIQYEDIDITVYSSTPTEYAVIVEDTSGNQAWGFMREDQR